MNSNCSDLDNQNQVPVPNVPIPAQRGRRQSGVVLDALATLPPDTLLDKKALAKALRVNGRTVQRLVAKYDLPPAVLFGSRKMWRVATLLEWFKIRESAAIREAEKSAVKFRQLGS